jgi:hypothetical protein
MAEVWLRTNRRALAIGLIVPAVIAGAGLLGLFWSLTSDLHWAWSTILAFVAAAPLWMVGELLYAMTQPRLAYESGEVLVYLEPTRPTRVPIEIVECFFLGQGPSELPKLRGRRPQTQNVVIRLAESAADWKEREVRPAFGQWRDGYITVRGSWCEPLTPGIMRRLNQRLADVQREQKSSVQQTIAS